MYVMCKLALGQKVGRANDTIVISFATGVRSFTWFQSRGRLLPEMPGSHIYGALNGYGVPAQLLWSTAIFQADESRREQTRLR